MNYYSIGAKIFLALMAMAFVKVGIETLIDPSMVMQQVDITLNTTSALSSMRAVYGGMHLSFGIYCAVSIFRNPIPGLGLVALYTAGFVIGRVSGIFNDGSPNAFVINWLIVESISMLIAVGLYLRLSRSVTLLGESGNTTGNNVLHGSRAANV